MFSEWFKQVQDKLPLPLLIIDAFFLKIRFLLYSWKDVPYNRILTEVFTWSTWALFSFLILNINVILSAADSRL